MNRRGLSGIADAMIFLALLTAAAGMIAACVHHDEKADVAEPSEVVDTLMSGRQSYRDLGITESPGGIAPMNRIAYVSLSNGDGCFADMMAR